MSSQKSVVVNAISMIVKGRTNPSISMGSETLVGLADQVSGGWEIDTFIGTIQGDGSIDFTANVGVGQGAPPSFAITPDFRVIEMHETNSLIPGQCQIYFHAGAITDGRYDVGKEYQLGNPNGDIEGSNPTVCSLDANTMIMVCNGKDQNESASYMIGTWIGTVWAWDAQWDLGGYGLCPKVKGRSDGTVVITSPNPATSDGLFVELYTRNGSQITRRNGDDSITNSSAGETAIGDDDSIYTVYESGGRIYLRIGAFDTANDYAITWQEDTVCLGDGSQPTIDVFGKTLAFAYVVLGDGDSELYWGTAFVSDVA